MQCQLCGAILYSNGFCPNCSSNSAAPNSQICCPKCGGRILNVISESKSENLENFDVGGNSGIFPSSAVPAEKPCVIGRISWLCLQCGNKFPNPADLKAELEITKYRARKTLRFCIFFAVPCLILLCVFLFTSRPVLADIFLILTIIFISAPVIPLLKTKIQLKKYNKMLNAMKQFH